MNLFGLIVQILNLIVEYEAIFTIALSALLVLLYFRQHQVMKSEQRAILDIYDCTVQDDEITVRVSNYGNGAVTEVSLLSVAELNEWPGQESSNSDSEDEMETEAKDDSSGEESEQESTDGEPVAVPANADRPMKKVNESGEVTREQSILPHTTKVPFRCEAPLGVKRGDEISRYANFSDGTRQLARGGVEEFRFQLYIKYKDELEDVRYKPINSLPNVVSELPSDGVNLEDSITGVLSGQEMNPPEEESIIRRLLRSLKTRFSSATD